MPKIKDPEKIKARDAFKEERTADTRPYTKKTTTTMPEIENNQNATTTNTETTNVTETTQQTTEQANTSGGGDGFIKPYKPYTGDMIEREYSTPKVNMALADMIIPEADYGAAQTQPQIDPVELLNKKPASTAPPLHTQMQEQTGFNKLPTAEQNAASALSADLVLEGYDMAHSFAKGFVKVSKEKLQGMAAENKINPARVVVPESMGQEQVTLEEMVNELNTSVDQILVVTDDFKEKVRPPLTRVLAKYGLGTSDEVFLIGMFGKDIATKSIQCVGIKKVLNQVLGVYSKEHVELYAMAQENERLKQERDAAVLREQTAAANAKAKVHEDLAAKTTAAETMQSSHTNLADTGKNTNDKTKNKKPSKSTALAKSEEKQD